MTARVARIRRHPIKAIGGEDLGRVRLDAARRLPGDRVWALLTEGGERFTVELAKVDGNEMTELLDGSGKPQKGVVVVQDDSRIPGADANGTIVDPSKLSHNTWTADGRHTLLLQPQTKVELLRGWLRPLTRRWRVFCLLSKRCVRSFAIR